jgi:hypothetical protein
MLQTTDILFLLKWRQVNTQERFFSVYGHNLKESSEQKQIPKGEGERNGYV